MLQDGVAVAVLEGSALTAQAIVHHSIARTTIEDTPPIEETAFHGAA